MAERIIRAVNHYRTALLAGYTTYRDLGSESMQDADANVRDAIARDLIPGPRLFVATRVLASTGSLSPELRTAWVVTASHPELMPSTEWRRFEEL
jgi:hypothetical protein